MPNKVRPVGWPDPIEVPVGQVFHIRNAMKLLRMWKIMCICNVNVSCSCSSSSSSSSHLLLLVLVVLVVVVVVVVFNLHLIHNS